MAQVTRQQQGKQAGLSAATRGGQVSKQRKKQKVVLERDQEDKKLRTVVSFRADPPQGYTFIPLGNPQLTNALKKAAVESNQKVHVVSTTPHASRHELSKQVHRVGNHFPTAVVAQVCAEYGIRLTSGGRVITDDPNDDKLFQRVYKNGRPALNVEKDQVAINTEAREIIKDLFPQIPDKDLFQIIKTAFALGKNRVGTADELPLIRRAQLSVVAHIRHSYSNYDKLLRETSYNEARHAVEQITLQKLVEWRGDDSVLSDGKHSAAEAMMLEVIVLSDEDDSDSEEDGVDRIQHDDVRVEEWGRDAYEPILRRPLSSNRDYMHEDAPSGYRFAPQSTRIYQPSNADLVARERSRHARWEEARRTYRLVPAPEPVYQRIYLPEPEPARQVTAHESSGTRLVRREYVDDGASAPSHYLHTTTSRHISPEYQDRTIRRYERVLDDPPVQRQILYRPRSPLVAPYPPSRPLTPPSQAYRIRGRSASPNAIGDRVLPSIEVPSGLQSPNMRRRNPFDSRQPLTNGEQRPYRERDIKDLNGNTEPTVSRQRLQDDIELRSTVHNPFDVHSRTYDGDKMVMQQSPRSRLDGSYADPGQRPNSRQYPSERLERVQYHAPPNVDGIVRRVMISDDDYRSRVTERRIEANIRAQPNPFDGASTGYTSRLEPLPPSPRQVDAQSRKFVDTPPRRILEPVGRPGDGPTQVYREYLPSSAPTSSAYIPIEVPPERRIINADQARRQGDRRFERIPDDAYIRR